MKASVFSMLLGSILLILLSATIHAEAQTRVMSAQEITSEINTMKDEVTRLQAEINTLEADNKLLSSQLDNTLSATISTEENSGGSALAFINFLLLIGLGGGVFYIYKNQSTQTDTEASHNFIENSSLTKTDFDVISRKIRTLEEKLTKSSTSQATDTPPLENLDKQFEKISAEITTLKVIQKELETRISENEKKVEDEKSDTTTDKKKTSKKSKPKKKKEEDVPNLFDLLEDEVEASFSETESKADETEEKQNVETTSTDDNASDTAEEESTETTPDSEQIDDDVNEIEIEDEDEVQVEAEPEAETITADDTSEKESKLQAVDEEDDITEENEDDISFDFTLDDEEEDVEVDVETETESESDVKEEINTKDKTISDSDSKVSLAPESEEEISDKADISDEEESESDKIPVDSTEDLDVDLAKQDDTEEPELSEDNNEFSDDFWEAVDALDSDKTEDSAQKPNDTTETDVRKSGFDLSDEKKDNKESAKPLFGLKQSSKKEEPKDKDIEHETAIEDVEVDKTSSKKTIDDDLEASADAQVGVTKPKQKEEPKTGNSLQDALARMKSLTDKSKAEKKVEEEERESKIERNEFGMPKVDVNAAGKSKLADNYDSRLKNLKEPEQYAIAARNYPEEQEIKENWALSLIKRGYKSKNDDDIIDAINIMEVIIKSGGRKEGLAHQIMADGLYYMGLIKGEKNYFNRANTQYKKVTEKSGYDGVSMYTNWGNSHINLFYLTNKDTHLKDALDKFKVVNNIYTHAGNYNIARVFNLMGNQEVAMEWLESAFKRKIRLPKLSEIKTEAALKSIVSNPHFQKLITKYDVT